MKMSWAKPPPLVAIGGTEEYLRNREVRNAALQTRKFGRSVVWAESDSEAVDALTSAETFGDPCLVIIDALHISPDTAQDLRENPHGSCILLVVDGDLNDSKIPALSHVHGAYRVEYTQPKFRKDKAKLAAKFARAEANSLLGKDSLPQPLAEALVRAAGSDLGVISYEVKKAAAFARAEGLVEIDKTMIQKLIKPTNSVDMGGVIAALRRRDQKTLSKELDKIRRFSTSDPVMLLLRAPTGPARQTHLWLKASYLKRLPSKDMASRLGISEWAVNQDLLPTLKAWSTKDLRKLLGRLAAVDRGVFLGAPSPWDALEAALLSSCARVR